VGVAQLASFRQKTTPADASPAIFDASPAIFDASPATADAFRASSDAQTPTDSHPWACAELASFDLFFRSDEFGQIRTSGDTPRHFATPADLESGSFVQKNLPNSRESTTPGSAENRPRPNRDALRPGY
jgi:hypothetical protein